jgi:hypothetical protein
MALVRVGLQRRMRSPRARHVRGPGLQSAVLAVRGTDDRACKDGSACRSTRSRKRAFKKPVAVQGCSAQGRTQANLCSA